MGLAGVILAAGESSRMGRDKALLPWPPATHRLSPSKEPDLRFSAKSVTAQGAAGRVKAPAPRRAEDSGESLPDASPCPSGTLLSSVIEALGRCCDLVIVVAGKNEPALRPVVYASGAFLVQNPSPERGQFSSLQTGLQEVLARGHDNVMVTLVDRPAPGPGTLALLVNSFMGRSHNCWAVVPEYDGKHGHPILIGREMIEKFLKASVAASAREIEHANQQHIAYVPVNDPTVTMNVDTPDEYASLQSLKP